MVTRSVELMRRLFAVLVGLVVLCEAAAAQSTALVVPPDAGGGIWLRLGPTAAASSVLYGQTADTATYLMMQWTNPTNMGNMAPYTCPAFSANCWSAWSPDVSGQQYTTNGQIHFLMRSKGDNLPCYVSGAGGYPYELDTFVGPIDSQNYPGYPDALLARIGLGPLTALTLNATVYPQYSAAMPVAQCGVLNLTKIIVSTTLNNATAGQTLFYQLAVFKDGTKDGPGFFSTTNPYGYRDDLSSYGGLAGGVTPFVATQLSLNLLPRLKAAIQSGTGGIDTTVANWTTGTLYVGALIYGKWTTVYEVWGTSLTATQ